jgi:hypothetical protein
MVIRVISVIRVIGDLLSQELCWVFPNNPHNSHNLYNPNDPNYLHNPNNPKNPNTPNNPNNSNELNNHIVSRIVSGLLFLKLEWLR